MEAVTRVELLETHSQEVGVITPYTKYSVWCSLEMWAVVDCSLQCWMSPGKEVTGV